MKNQNQYVLVIITMAIAAVFLACDSGIKYDLPIFTVTYNANGATSGTAPAPMSAIYNTDITLPNQGTLTRTGYSFMEWSDSNSGTGKKYIPGDSFTVTGSQTLYAIWNISRTITFNANGATSGTAPSAVIAGEGSAITLPNQGTLVKTGYNFVYWNTQADGSGDDYTAGALYTVKGDVTLYAIFDNAYCSVSFHGNGATSGTAPSAQIVNINSVITLPGRDSLIKTGYEFTGWNTKADGTGSAYTADSSYTVTGSITLYAMWKDLELFTVPGDTLTAKLDWLDTNASSYNNYYIAVNRNETISPRILRYNNRSNITIILEHANAKRIITLNSNGSMFTVGSGVTLVLSNNITLEGRSSNNAALVTVNSGGTLVMNSGSAITGNTNSSYYGSNFGGGVFVDSGGTFTMNDGIISKNTASSSRGGGVCVIGIFTKTGGTIYGYNSSDSNSNSSSYGNNNGHAVYAYKSSSPTVTKIKDTTAGPLDKLSFNGSTGVTSGVWDNPIITYDRNGATGTAPPAQEVTRNTDITLPGQGSLSRTGYVFRGWNTKADGSGDNYTAGSSYTVESDIIFYAKWEITYTVSQNGGLYYTTTEITLTFSTAPQSLTISDITFGSRITKGSATLTGTGTTRTISGFTVNSTGSTAISIESGNIESEEKSIYVYLSIPSTPTGVSATSVSSSSITVNWNSAANTSEYRVYRSTSSSAGYTQVGTPTGTSFTDTGLSANTQYYYRVSAYNNSGESSQSSYVSAWTSPGSPPENVSATALPFSIIIGWDSVPGASNYRIYYSTSSAGPYTNFISSSTNSCTHTGLSLSTTYYYRVAVYNNSSLMAGEQSDYVSATTSSNTAALLTQDVWENGNILSSGIREQWFRFTAAASTQYIHFKPGTLTYFSVQLYNSSGTTVGVESYISSATYISRTVTNNQTYYIRVTPSSSYSGTYQIAFNNSTTSPE